MATECRKNHIVSAGLLSLPPFPFQSSTRLVRSAVLPDLHRRSEKGTKLCIRRIYFCFYLFSFIRVIEYRLLSSPRADRDKVSILPIDPSFYIRELVWSKKKCPTKRSRRRDEDAVREGIQRLKTVRVTRTILPVSLQFLFFARLPRPFDNRFSFSPLLSSPFVEHLVVFSHHRLCIPFTASALPPGPFVAYLFYSCFFL